MMLWVMSFHIIFMVAWFAGLFYLPRLFVYHAASENDVACEQFKIMEHKLFWYIMTPAGILTSVFGVWLFLLNWHAYLMMGWMHAKLFLVFLLWCYHIYCGYLLQQFAFDENKLSSKFYRFFNEFPTIILIAVVILVVVKP